MTLSPALVLLTLAVALGSYLGLLYLRDVRRPYLIGIHLLLGAGGLEASLLGLHGAASDSPLRTGSLGTLALGFLAATLILGLTAPLFGRNSPRTAEVLLATHVTFGITGFALFLAWVSKT